MILIKVCFLLISGLSLLKPVICQLCVPDSASGACFNYAGETCTIPPPTPPPTPQEMCIPTANCFNQNGSPICVCHHPLQAVDTNNPAGRKVCRLVHGDRCSQRIDLCDPLPFLKCSLENKCDCEKDGWYDSVANLCFILPGSHCTGVAGEIGCIADTSCQPPTNGTCQCEAPEAEPNLELDGPNFCVWSHGEDCTGTGAQCDPTSHLECDGATCICAGEPITSFYDEGTKTCLRLPEEDCQDGMKCVPGAVCNNFQNETKCRCRPPLSLSNNRCYIQHGLHCSRQNDLCDFTKWLRCDLGGKCSCQQGAVFINDICKLLPGSSNCSFGAESPDCIEGSHCELDLTGMKCKCDNPFSEPSLDDPTKCYLAHGINCNAPPGEECSPYFHLECEGGVCHCQGESSGVSIYDPTTKTCLRLADEDCEPHGMGCIHSAHCVKEGSEYKCECRFPMSRGKDGFCYLHFSQNCTQANDLCDPEEYISCDYEGKCACGPGAVYLPLLRMCQLLPGSDCSLGPESPACIEGSQCPRVPGKCECRNPLSKPSLDDPKKCFLSHGIECKLPFEEREDECDPYSHLECMGYVCLCQGESSKISIYDPKTKKCLRLADEKCEPVGMSCIHSANCRNESSQYKCECRYPMSRGKDGFCYLHVGQDCTQANDLCDPNEYLSCNLEGKCSCGPEAIFVPLWKTCQLLPGSNCSLGPESPACIFGSQCPRVPGKCECKNPLANASIHDPTQCYLSHGIECKYPVPGLLPGEEDECNPYFHLECKGDVCQCQGESSQHSIYDPKTKECLRLADEDCEPDGMSCIHSANCMKEGSEYKCDCRYPMSRGTDGFCYLQHTQNCTQLNDLCNPLKFLVCDLEGMCSCQTGSVFDSLLQTCVILPSFGCQDEPNGQQCINGTNCKMDPISRKFRCQCGVLLSQPSKDDPRKCFLSHGKACTPLESACDPFANLECSGELCLCQGEKISSTYDSKTRKCLRLAGERCSPESDGGMGCIPTASCKMIDSQYECQCRHPMSKGIDGFCYLQYNQNCTMQNDFCNGHKFLTCDYEGQCSCRKGTIYNETLDTCLLLPEQECHPQMGSQDCVQSTKCLIQPGPTTKFACQCPGVSRPSKVNPTFCVLAVNEPCPQNTTDGEICDPFAYLECSKNFECVCTGGGFRVYLDSETMTCYLKAGQSCVPPEKNALAQKCTPNSNCFQNGGLSICDCKAGFEVNRNGHCFLPHLSRCSLKNDLCDPASYLKCDLENHCTCGKEAMFNEQSQTCELLSNATCLPPQFGSQPPPQPCIPNSICHPTKRRCECIGYFEENIDRQCFFQRTAPCDKSRDFCDVKSFLSCNRPPGDEYFQCLCQGEEEGLGWFNAFQKKCFRLAGALCGRQDESGCIPNAYCDPVDKRCVCNETLRLVPNQNKFCFIPHSVACNTRNDLCDPAAFLECQQNQGAHFSENTCGCARGYETFYDEATSSCRLISDRPCNPGTGLIHTPTELQLCDENARCLPHAAGNFTYRCRCNDKYVPNPEGICYLSYKSRCAEDPASCDPYGYLKCRKRFKAENYQNTTNDVRQCICETDEMYYYEETKQCLTFPGEVCDVSRMAQKCRKNAKCGKNHVCECESGYEITPDRQCLLKYGEKCEYSKDCHTHANLECRAGFCLCPEGYIEHHYYDGEHHQNSTMCIPGYKMKCETKLWLDFPNLQCSPEAFLQCNENENRSICLCQHLDQVFLGPERQCRSIRGMVCDGFERLCVPGADCIRGGILNEDTRIDRCECGQNYTINWMDPKFCVSGSCSLVQNAPLISLSFVLYYFTRVLTLRL